MRGDDKIQVKVGCLVFLDYRLDTFEAAHDANLVEVRHDGRRAMGENRLGKRTNRQVRALWVNVPIDKAGRNVCTLGINNRGALSDGIVDIANGGNGLAAHGNATRVDLTGINVDDLAVLDYQICRYLASSNTQ